MAQIVAIEHGYERRGFALESNGKTKDRREARHAEPIFKVADVCDGQMRLLPKFALSPSAAGP